MKRVIYLLFSFLVIQSQSVSSSSDLFIPLQRSLDIVLSSNSFHTAKVEDSFGFDIGVSHQFVKFPDFGKNLYLDDKKIDVLNMRTVRAGIDLPIYLQFGIHITLPSFKFQNYDTNLLGYFAKFQIDQIFSDKLPNIALQFNSSQIEIGSFLTSQTDSYQLQFSSKVLFIDIFAGMLLNKNVTEFKFEEMNDPMKDNRQEFYYRAGLNLELFFLNVYGEISINEEMDYKNISVGLSLKI